MSRRSRPADKNLLDVRVITMDAEMEFTVGKAALGKDLFDLVCRAIGLRETWYFGLQYYDIKGMVCWLKPKKPLLKQNVSPDGRLVFQFLVRFYPEDVAEELVQDITQHLFFLQIRAAILEGHIYCPPEEAILLASYDVQVRWGDLDEVVGDQVAAVNLDDLIPTSLYRQFPDTPRQAWLTRIRQWHAEHGGLSRIEAQLEHLKVAQNLEMFGVSFFQISNKKDSELYLGVTAFGLNMYEKHERRKPKISFLWSEIKNVSYEDTKFILRPVDKKAHHFSFYSCNLKMNKVILDLCMGNHELYLRRRKPDTIEVQQMKLQAKEEKIRRHLERQRYIKERQMREELQREKQELQRQLLQMQEEIRLANEEMRQSQEAAEVLAKKAQICEEESVLLNQKAMDAENEIQQLKLSVLRSEEDRLSLEQKVREAQMLAAQMVDEAERRAQEAQVCRNELVKAKMMEKMACNRLVEIGRPPLYFPPEPEYRLLESYDGGVENGSTASLERLSLEIERERLEYHEKSRHLRDQLNELRSELEIIKTDDGSNGAFPSVDVMGMRKEKFATLQKASSGSTKMRISTFENL